MTTTINTTEAESSSSSSSSSSAAADHHNDNNISIAIVLPCVFAVVICLLFAFAFLILKVPLRGWEQIRDERKKIWLKRLDESVQVQRFADWVAAGAGAGAGAGKEGVAATTTAAAAAAAGDHTNPHTICVICLDEIEQTAPIRPLGCNHVFHQACLEDWYTRWNEFCPLCHRPIVPGACAKWEGDRYETSRPPPPIALVA